MKIVNEVFFSDDMLDVTYLKPFCNRVDLLRLRQLSDRNFLHRSFQIYIVN